MNAYKLNPLEIEIALLIAKVRNGKARSRGYQAPTHGGEQTAEKQMQLDIDGAEAEIAAARILNLCPDFGTEPGDSDLVSPVLGTIDVKTTRRLQGRLMVSPKSAKGSDSFVLMLNLGSSTYVFAGLAPQKQVCAEQNVKQIRGKHVFSVSQAELQQLGT